jgi:3-hydroxyisobutyrate dehydrogenase
MEGVPSSNNYEGGFASELMLKDLGIAVDAAEKVNVNVNLGKLSKTIYENVVKQGLAKKDFSVVYDLIDKKKL